MKTHKGAITTVLILAITAIILGILLPGVLLYNNNIFSADDVINRLDSTTKKHLKIENNEKQQIQMRQEQLMNIIKDTGQKISPEEINNIYLSLHDLQNLESQKSKIIISPYYPKNKTLLIWPLLYFGLFMIIFFNPEIIKTKISFSFYLVITFLILILWRCGTWFRNTTLGSAGRVYYSINNIDISKFGFYLQEVQSLFAILIVSYIICKWVAYSDFLKKKFNANPSISDIYENSALLKKLYQQWQLSSVFLALAFSYYTYYFWLIININNDMRYFPSAVLIHFVWGITWLAMSLPLITTNKLFNFHKSMQLNPKFHILKSQEKEEWISITNFDPISSQNKLATTLISAITFLLPIIKGFF